MTRSALACEVAKKLELYLKSMVRSRCREIVCPALFKSKPQKSHPIDTSTPEWRKIREGFMHLENMFLVRLNSSCEGTLQPEIWVVDPASDSLPSSQPGTTEEDRVQLGKAQLVVSPPSSVVSVPDPTITSSTTLGGPRAEHTVHLSLFSQSAATADGWTRHDMVATTGAELSSIAIDHNRL